MLEEMGPDCSRTPTSTLVVSICKAPVSRPRHAGAKDGKWLGGPVERCRCIHANLHRRPVYIWILACLLGARGVVRSWAVTRMCGSDPAVVSGSDPCLCTLAGAVHGRYPVQGLGTLVWPQGATFRPFPWKAPIASLGRWRIKQPFFPFVLSSSESRPRGPLNGDQR
jgi:hypothetical protein